MTTYGYIRTSRQRIQGTAGSDPEAQAHQLRQEGVPEANISRDVGVSGGTGTNSRAGWRALNAQLVSGDILVVVAIDRIGRRWMDTVNAVRDPRTREVRIRSLAESEATWVTYLAAEAGHCRGGDRGYSDHLHGLGRGAGAASGEPPDQGRLGAGQGRGEDPGSAYPG